MVKQGKFDLTLYRGDSVVLDMVFTDIDETGSTPVSSALDLTNINVTAQCRYSQNDPQVWLTMTPTIIDAKKGQIRITITSTESAGLVDPLMGSPVSGVYDVQFKSKTNAQEVFTPLAGSFSVILNVTRS